MIPQEIYGEIFKFVHGWKDLTSLCLVSRTVHAEVIRVLYSEVTLPTDDDVLLQWAALISEKPQLASLVVSLSFGIAVLDNIEELEAVGKALGLLGNLKS
jgi:hypothetical protein